MDEILSNFEIEKNPRNPYQKKMLHTYWYDEMNCGFAFQVYHWLKIKYIEKVSKYVYFAIF